MFVRKYNQHDDRDGPNVGGHGHGGSHNKVWSRLGSRQVSFGDDGAPGIRNRGGIFKKGRGKFHNKQIHVIVPDDEDMGGDNEHRGDQAGRGRPLPRMGGRGGSKYKFTRGGPGRTPPGIVVGGRNNAGSLFSWQKVVLKNGTKYDKIELLKKLLAQCSVKFIPICYSKSGMNTYFYLEDASAARAIKELDKKIEMPDGFPLQISIERSTPPNMPLTDELVDKVKQVMSSR